MSGKQWWHTLTVGAMAFILGHRLSAMSNQRSGERNKDDQDAVERLEKRLADELLDAKAGIALGFSGALIALAPDGWPPLVVFGTTVDLAAAGAALLAFSMRPSVDLWWGRDKAAWVGRATNLLAASVLLLGISVLVDPVQRVSGQFQCWLGRGPSFISEPPKSSERWDRCWRDYIESDLPPLG